MKIENLTITEIKEVQKGTSKAGKEWQKVEFVGTTQEQYNNLYCFEIFGDEKVENFKKYNKVGSVVDVDFNVQCSEYQGKHYTKLAAWKVFKAESNAIDSDNNKTVEEKDDLPF
jgi:hypothetical protein